MRYTFDELLNSGVEFIAILLPGDKGHITLRPVANRVIMVSYNGEFLETVRDNGTLLSVINTIRACNNIGVENN